MKRFGIRSWVALLTLIPSLLMVISLEAWFLHERFSDLDRDLLERGKLVAHQLASSSEYGVFSSNLEFLQAIGKGVLQQPDVRGLVILDAASEPIIRAGEFSGYIKNGLEGFDSAQSEYLGAPQFVSNEKNEVNPLNPIRSSGTHLWIYHPIIPEQIALDDLQSGGNATRQLGAVIVEMSKLGTEKLKTSMLWLTILTTLLFVGVVLYLVHRASTLITQPIRRLSDTMSSLKTGSLEQRASLRTRIKELETLGYGLDEMASDLQEQHKILQQRIDEATQALRIKKEEAERASYGKSHFLAVASHELRQPLHALGFYIDELQRRVADPEQQHLVGQVEHSVEALSALLNALLDISKLDAGSIVPQKRSCNVKAMMEHISEDYRVLAEVKNIRLVIRPCEESVISDPLLLERIVANLVGNGIRYTGINGSVMVACRRRGASLRIEVRDNGIGIPKENQSNVFREFFQLNQPQLDAGKGLGLGLSIVDRLVKLLGHRLELRSAPNKGSVFSVEVPIASASERISDAFSPAEAGQMAEKTELRGKRLLVVDDDPAILSGTTALITSWGCEVDGATSAQEVAQYLADGKEWDFIISDYHLQDGTDGIEIVNMVCGHHERAIPRILISGDTNPATAKLASTYGYHLLHKPVKPAKLRSLVLHMLNSTA